MIWAKTLIGTQKVKRAHFCHCKIILIRHKRSFYQFYFSQQSERLGFDIFVKYKHKIGKTSQSWLEHKSHLDNAWSLNSTTYTHVTGRQLLAELAERVVGEVWDPDSSLPCTPPTEARGAQGISPEGDQKRAQGDIVKPPSLLTPTSTDQRGCGEPTKGCEGQEVCEWREPHCEEVHHQTLWAAGGVAGARLTALSYSGESLLRCCAQNPIECD